MSGKVGFARLFDAHCHLQDRRISAVTPQLIRVANDVGVRFFAVNGVSEGDWHSVKRMGEDYSCVLPCFGLHPWYVEERSPNWFESMKKLFDETPSAAVGEIGLDKGSLAQHIDYKTQVEVFEQQLELAKELQRPVSIHCVRAHGDLLEIMRRVGPFPAGVVLHSYIGSAEMVPALAKLGSYFSFSGHLTSFKKEKAKKIAKSVPLDKIFLETDAPDGLPKVDPGSLVPVPDSDSCGSELQNKLEETTSPPSSTAKGTLNHPANIVAILSYVADLLDMPEEELAEISYRNAVHVFSYKGSKVSSNVETPN